MTAPGTILLPPRGAVFTIGLVIMLVGMHAISSMLLTELGFAYEQPGGNPLTKIHPATLFAATFLVISALSTGRPFAWLEQELASTPGGTALTVMTIIMILHTAFFMRLPFTGFIDTFIGPIHVYYLCKAVQGQRARALAIAIHTFMIVNASIGLGEYLTGQRLIPFWVEGRIIEGDWRSTSLLGHPLTNASMTGCYLIALAVGGGRDIPRIVVMASFALNALAMIPFGGRASSILVILVLAMVAIGWTIRLLQGAPVSRLSVATGVLIMPLLIGGAVAAYEMGFFQQFVERFIDDQGSAQTRVGMFELLARFSFWDLLMFPDAKLVETYQHMHGLEFGIESFWVSFILQYGIIMSMLLFAALFWFIHDVVRQAQPSSVYIMLFFFAVASTSVSLNGKGHQLSIVVAQVLILMRRPEDALAAAPAPGPGMGHRRAVPARTIAAARRGTRG